MGRRILAQLALVVRRASTSPSRTTTAPIGTSSCPGACSASRSASRMKYSSRGKKRSLIGLAADSATVLPPAGLRRIIITELQ